MSQPEERDILSCSERNPSSPPSSTSSISHGGSVRRVLMSSTRDDERGDKIPLNNGSKDRAAPPADGDRPGHKDPAQMSAPAGPNSLHRGVVSPRGSIGGDRTYQFRKTKSAATFMLDGVSYTIGKC